MPEDLSNKSAGHCAQCGAPLRANAQFCTACGAPATGASPASARPSKAKGSKRSRVWLAVGAMVLVVAVVGAGLVWFDDAQQPAPNAPLAIPTAPVASQDIPFPNVARVAVEQAHMSAMSGDALIVDVRDREFYDTSHIRGSLSLPASELPARLAELPRDKTILTYCTWPAEEASARAAQYLLDQGYSNVAAILGGLAAWQEIGFPIEWALLRSRELATSPQLCAGNSTGLHVHFEVWQDGSKANPLSLMPASPDQ